MTLKAQLKCKRCLMYFDSEHLSFSSILETLQCLLNYFRTSLPHAHTASHIPSPPVLLDSPGPKNISLILSHDNDLIQSTQLQKYYNLEKGHIVMFIFYHENEILHDTFWKIFLIEIHFELQETQGKDEEQLTPHIPGRRSNHRRHGSW